MVFCQFSESISGESAIELWDIQWEILAQSTVGSIFEAVYESSDNYGNENTSRAHVWSEWIVSIDS